MARIRSTHPGQWTDEAFATLSALAHLLAIGLRNEADDGGIFEWRPVQLKMRLLPLYDCDVAHLLVEIERNEIIRSYEVDGKRYGAIRNFCRYQSPDKPREIYPRAEWVDAYVGKKPRAVAPAPPTPTRPKGDDRQNGSRPVADQSPTVPPRKGREGIGEEGNGVAPATAPPPGEAYHWSGKVIHLNRPDFDRWAMSFPELNVAAHLVDLDEWMASPKVTDAERKRWFQAVAGALRKRHDRAVNERKAADQKRTAQTSAVTDAQRRREAEERCRAEGINPQTREGLARVAELARAAA